MKIRGFAKEEMHETVAVSAALSWQANCTAWSSPSNENNTKFFSCASEHCKRQKCTTTHIKVEKLVKQHLQVLASTLPDWNWEEERELQCILRGAVVRWSMYCHITAANHAAMLLKYHVWIELQENCKMHFQISSWKKIRLQDNALQWSAPKILVSPVGLIVSREKNVSMQCATQKTLLWKNELCNCRSNRTTQKCTWIASLQWAVNTSGFQWISEPSAEHYIAQQQWFFLPSFWPKAERCTELRCFLELLLVHFLVHLLIHFLVHILVHVLVHFFILILVHLLMQFLIYILVHLSTL